MQLETKNMKFEILKLTASAGDHLHPLTTHIHSQETSFPSHLHTLTHKHSHTHLFPHIFTPSLTNTPHTPFSLISSHTHTCTYGEGALTLHMSRSTMLSLAPLACMVWRTCWAQRQCIGFLFMEASTAIM